nr:hypothetical protein Iba_chr07dCG5510 [Ipomoea batatas]
MAGISSSLAKPLSPSSTPSSSAMSYARHSPEPPGGTFFQLGFLNPSLSFLRAYDFGDGVLLDNLQLIPKRKKCRFCVVRSVLGTSVLSSSSLNFMALQFWVLAKQIQGLECFKFEVRILEKLFRTGVAQTSSILVQQGQLQYLKVKVNLLVMKGRGDTLAKGLVTNDLHNFFLEVEVQDEVVFMT